MTRNRFRLTATTSERHRILLDCALARTSSGSTRYEFLQRLGRSLEEFGSMTPAMVETCRLTILSSLA